MKRFLLSVLSFGMFFSYANASKCEGAENSMTRCYEISAIRAGLERGIAAPSGAGLHYGGYNKQTNRWHLFEDLRAQTSTVRQTQYVWFATELKYLYGEDFFGVLVDVDSYRTKYTAEEQPVRVTIGAKFGVLVSQGSIIKDGYVIGQRYRYFIRHVPLSQVSTYGDINVKENIEVYASGNSGLEVKDSVSFNQL